jgi:hypothetical protein
MRFSHVHKNLEVPALFQEPEYKPLENREIERTAGRVGMPPAGEWAGEEPTMVFDVLSIYEIGRWKLP